MQKYGHRRLSDFSADKILSAYCIGYAIYNVSCVSGNCFGIRKRDFSSTVCFIYSLSGIIGISQLAGTHPLSSMLNILFGNQLSLIATDEGKI